MSELIAFYNEINLLPSRGSSIFATSERKNAFKKEIYDSVITLINNNIDYDKTLRCIDFFCGHGIVLNQIKKTYNSEVIGIDINKFSDWNVFNNVYFSQKDVFDVIKLNPIFKFDIVVTLNTLRADSKRWGQERYNNFLAWCNKHSNYLITNKCTNKNLTGFQLIDTIQPPNIFDINLFKAINNE
jgi:hypothetical protein